MQYFTKPWAMTTVMFLGMSFCLPWAYWEEYKHKKQAKEALQSANGDISDPLLYGESLVSFYLLVTSTSTPAPSHAGSYWKAAVNSCNKHDILLIFLGSQACSNSLVNTLHNNILGQQAMLSEHTQLSTSLLQKRSSKSVCM